MALPYFLLRALCCVGCYLLFTAQALSIRTDDRQTSDVLVVLPWIDPFTRGGSVINKYPRSLTNEQTRQLGSGPCEPGPWSTAYTRKLKTFKYSNDIKFLQISLDIENTDNTDKDNLKPNRYKRQFNRFQYVPMYELYFIVELWSNK